LDAFDRFKGWVALGNYLFFTIPCHPMSTSAQTGNLLILSGWASLLTVHAKTPKT
jgi:hypothetical protein